MEEFELFGDWWLPKERRKKFSGILTFSHEDGLQLRTTNYSAWQQISISKTNNDMQDFIDGKAIAPVIVGQAEGRRLTLYKCRYSIWGTIGIPEMVFIGDHFNSERQLRFRRIGFRFAFQDAWLGKSSIETELNDIEGGKAEFKAIHRTSTILGFKLSNAKVEIREWG